MPSFRYRTLTILALTATTLTACSGQDAEDGASRDASEAPSPAVAASASSTDVPAEFTEPLEQAGATCDEVSPELLAAVMSTDTGFATDKTTAGGAVVGPAALTAEAWDKYGDGPETDRSDPAAATHALAAQLCDYTDLATTGIEDKGWSGSVQDIALAIRSVGLGAVTDASGVPDFPEVTNSLDAIDAALTPETPDK